MLCTILLRIENCGGLLWTVEGCSEMCRVGEGRRWRGLEVERVGGGEGWRWRGLEVERVGALYRIVEDCRGV